MKAEKIVCKKCGDIGYEEALVYCSKCHVSAEHRYCLDEVLEDPCQDIVWQCPQCTRLVSSCQVPVRSSFHRGQVEKDKSGYNKAKSVCHLPVRKPSPRTFFVGKKPLYYKSLQTTCTSKPKANVDVVGDGTCTVPQVVSNFKTHNSSHDKNGVEIEAVDTVALSSDDKKEVKIEADDIVGPSGRTTDGLDLQCRDNHLHFVSASKFQCIAMPLVEPIWSGSFDICHSKYGPIMGHLSGTACQRAWNAAKSMPKSLHLEKKSRLDIWPDSFKRSQPREDNIALFFFPGTNRVCIEYAGILNQVTCHDMALRAHLHDSELLIFSSIQLPASYQNFLGDMYLWGVFRGNLGTHHGQTCK